MATSLLVIGYGNALRGDDGAGRRAATLIDARREGRGSGGRGNCGVPLRVLAVHQLLPEFAHDIAHAARVVFIDAYAASLANEVTEVNDGAAPLRVEVVEGRVGPGTHAAHASSPAALLALSARLYGRVPQAWVVGIPAYEFAPGAAISPRTAQRIEDAVDFCLAQGER